MKRFFEIIDLIVGTINQTMAVFGLSVGVLLAFMNVILRYVFDMSLTWAAELTNYLFIWSALFGAAYGFKQGAHISVSLFIEKFPPQITKFFLVFANSISIAYLGLMSYLGYNLIFLLKDFGEDSVDLGIPMWIPHLVLPIAFGLAAYRCAEKLVALYKTDSNEIKLFSEHEAVIHEVTSQKGGK
ncbi:MAG: TRAP transporter small permease [Campylobacterales bacterium]|nr:TRAP transporter small permease [Campylobacterales bacterium]